MFNVYEVNVTLKKITGVSVLALLTACGGSSLSIPEIETNSNYVSAASALYTGNLFLAGSLGANGTLFAQTLNVATFTEETVDCSTSGYKTTSVTKADAGQVGVNVGDEISIQYSGCLGRYDYEETGNSSVSINDYDDSVLQSKVRTLTQTDITRTNNSDANDNGARKEFISAASSTILDDQARYTGVNVKAIYDEYPQDLTGVLFGSFISEELAQVYPLDQEQSIERPSHKYRVFGYEIIKNAEFESPQIKEQWVIEYEDKVDGAASYTAKTLSPLVIEERAVTGEDGLGDTQKVALSGSFEIRYTSGAVTTVTITAPAEDGPAPSDNVVVLYEATPGGTVERSELNWEGFLSGVFGL